MRPSPVAAVRHCSNIWSGQLKCWLTRHIGRVSLSLSKSELRHLISRILVFDPDRYCCLAGWRIRLETGRLHCEVIQGLGLLEWPERVPQRYLGADNRSPVQGCICGMAMQAIALLNRPMIHPQTPLKQGSTISALHACSPVRCDRFSPPRASSNDMSMPCHAMPSLPSNSLLESQNTILS